VSAAVIAQFNENVFPLSLIARFIGADNLETVSDGVAEGVGVGAGIGVGFFVATPLFHNNFLPDLMHV